MAFTSRWSARLAAGWPQVRVVRVFTQEGTRAWEIHLTPRPVTAEAESSMPVQPPSAAPPRAAGPPSAEPEPASQPPPLPSLAGQLLAQRPAAEPPPAPAPAPPVQPAAVEPAAVQVQPAAVQVQPAAVQPVALPAPQPARPAPAPAQKPAQPSPVRPIRPPQVQTWFSPTVQASELPRRPTAASHAARRGLSRSPYSPPPHAPPPPNAPAGDGDLFKGNGLFTPASGEPATGEPATDQPIIDQPPTAEPVIAEPAMPEPVVDEPVIHEPAAVYQPPAVDESPTGQEPPDGPAVFTWIPLRATRDGLDESLSRLVNRYMVTIHATVDLAEALRHSLVNDVLHRVARDPEDRRLRDDLIAELTAVPCPPRFATTIFDLSTLRTMGDEIFLDGLLVIRTQGIQVGEPGRQSSHVTYVVTATAEATRFLEANPELAGALVDNLCPSPSGAGNGADLDRLLRAAIDAQDLTPAVRTHLPSSQRKPGSERGTVLRVEQVDGTVNGSKTVLVNRHLTDSHVAKPERLPPAAAIDDPDRILELDPKTIDLHPSLGEYLAALSDHIGYEVGTRSDSRADHPDLTPDVDDSDLGFGIAGR